jgi:hypothetical protein
MLFRAYSGCNRRHGDAANVIWRCQDNPDEPPTRGWQRIRSTGLLSGISRKHAVWRESQRNHSDLRLPIAAPPTALTAVAKPTLQLRPISPHCIRLSEGCNGAFNCDSGRTVSDDQQFGPPNVPGSQCFTLNVWSRALGDILRRIP